VDLAATGGSSAGIEARRDHFPLLDRGMAPVELFLTGRRYAPVVAVVHNPADHGAGLPARKAAGAVLGRCSAFLCHSRSVAQVLQERFPGTPLTVHPLPPESPGPSTGKARGHAWA